MTLRVGSTVYENIPLDNISLEPTNPGRVIFINPYFVDEHQVIDRGFSHFSGTIAFSHTNREEPDDPEVAKSADELRSFLSNIVTARTVFYLTHFRPTIPESINIASLTAADDDHNGVLSSAPHEDLSIGQFLVGPYVGGGSQQRLFIITELDGAEIRLYPQNYMVGTYNPSKVVLARYAPSQQLLYEHTLDATRKAVLPTSIDFEEIGGAY